MNRSAVLLAALLLAVPVLGQVDTSWVRHFQHSPSFPSQFMSYYRSMVPDGAGNILLGCYGQYDAADQDMIVLKYRPDGRLLWSARHGGGDDEAAYAIAADRNNCVYVAGQVYSYPTAAMLVAKFDSAGLLLWAQKVYGDTTAPYGGAYAVTVQENRVYVTGTVCNRASGQDLALARLDAASGAVSWIRTLSRSSSFNVAEAGLDVLTDGAGRVFVCGQVADPLVVNSSDALVACYDELGNLLWERTFDNSGSQDYVRRLALLGTTVVAVGATVSGGNANLLLIARTNLGGLLWWQQYDGAARLADYGHDVAFAADGGVLACGLTTSATTRSDMLLLKYTSAGVLQWTRQYDRGAGHDAAYDMSVDAAGNVVMAGYSYESPSVGLPDMTAVKYSGSGTFGWAFFFRPAGAEGANVATSVVCAGTDVFLGGTAHWGFPNYYDPTLLRLQEVPDVGVQAILAPAGTVSPLSPVTPRATVRNHSFQPATFRCRMSVSDGYAAEVPVTLGPGLETTVAFPDWTPQLTGYWAVRCSTMSDFDYDRANDARDTMVYVSGPAVDVGVRGLVTPSGNVRYQSAIVPTARWHNFGTAAVDFTALVFVDGDAGRVYSEARVVRLAANGRDTVLQFPAWVADRVGYFTVKCSTALVGDGVAANDMITFRFGVTNMPAGEWVRMQDVPGGSSGRAVSKGGALAGDDSELFALKGNKTREVFRFDPASGRWSALPDLPAGPSVRPVSAGGALCAGGHGLLYVVRGNKTSDLLRYDSTVGWAELASVPPGPRNKTLKGGTGMDFTVLNDTGYVYLLKGSGTAEFYRYDVVRDTWEALPDAPAGASGKPKYKDGSGVVVDSDSILYCLKANYNEVFRFDLRSGNWRSGQTDVPFYNASGRKKKVKKGGAVAWGDGLLTVLKGGGTFEFWKLDGADSAWRELPPVPPGDMNRKVNDGAGLEHSRGSFFVLKGGKSAEFWRFTSSALDGPMAAGSLTQPVRTGLSALPSSVCALTAVGLDLVARGGAAVVDMSGRVVARPADGKYNPLSGKALSPGVYVVLMRGNGGEPNRKVILVR